MTPPDVPLEIKEAYRTYGKRLDDRDYEFPYTMQPDIQGGYHLEIKDDGKLALVNTERLKEDGRLETKSIDELMYFIFKCRVQAQAHNQEKPLEERKKDAVELISRIDPKWGERLAREQVENAKEMEERVRRLMEKST